MERSKWSIPLKPHGVPNGNLEDGEALRPSDQKDSIEGGKSLELGETKIK